MGKESHRGDIKTHRPNVDENFLCFLLRFNLSEVVF